MGVLGIILITILGINAAIILWMIDGAIYFHKLDKKEQENKNEKGSEEKGYR